MSNLIEVSKGISININSILEVEEVEDGCIVHTERGSYKSVFQYRLFLNLIEKEEKERVQEVKLDKKSQTSLDSLGFHFAG